MTAKIIAFPGAEPPPAETPEITRGLVRDQILTAVSWYEQGLRSEDLPADMDPDMREMMKVILGVFERGERS